MPEVVTVTQAEEAATEEAACEAIVDQAFVPLGVQSTPPSKWLIGTTYAKNDLSLEGTQVYRSQAAGNVGNKPSEDTDFVHWAPVCIALTPLANPALLTAPTTRKQQAHNNKPPASSAATATAAETIGVGAETPV